LTGALKEVIMIVCKFCIYSVLVLAFACKPQSHIYNYLGKSGVVEKTMVLTEPFTEGPTDPGQKVVVKIFFRDSFAIEEVVSIKTDIGPKNVINHQYILEHFRFNDLRHKAIYLYHSFSDTAFCFNKYSFADTIPVVGGWGFNLYRKNHYAVEPVIKGDTTIEGVKYKRADVTTMQNGHKAYQLFFFRCDKAIQPFNFDSSLSEKTGCPLTLSYYTDSSFSAKPILMDKIEFLRDTLTKVENTVFDAWERYAKAHPVRGKSL
jgi:hypothetical protein